MKLLKHKHVDIEMRNVSTKSIIPSIQYCNRRPVITFHILSTFLLYPFSFLNRNVTIFILNLLLSLKINPLTKGKDPTVRNAKLLPRFGHFKNNPKSRLEPSTLGLFCYQLFFKKVCKYQLIEFIQNAINNTFGLRNGAGMFRTVSSRGHF